MEYHWLLSPDRQLTEEEKALVWQKSASHVDSDAERRICQAVERNWHRGELKLTNILLEGDAGSGKTQLAKALSADFGLPYTKITCFADMDKSDILGAILPVIGHEGGAVQYEYYPSEIVRAYENGWLLEIQELTVIRDAAVLMALNSALEPGGSINLPTRIVRRHPDFMAVITTNRGYNGCRPLNEALRDRIQHAEKMDLPPVEVMAQRAALKTGCQDWALLHSLARALVLLDQTAKANAIKGVAGMRSYFYWVDAVLQGTDVVEALYHKVLYKITTDDTELALLEQALQQQGIWDMLPKAAAPYGGIANGEEVELRADGSFTTELAEVDKESPSAVALKRSADSEGHSDGPSQSIVRTERQATDEDGTPFYHALNLGEEQQLQEEKRSFRKQLNRQAREAVKGSIHEKIGLIVHRPEAATAQKEAYRQAAQKLRPVIEALARKVQPLLEQETAVSDSGSRFYGIKFHAEKVGSPDLRYFSKKNPPEETPSLAVALRIDQSASMSAFGRLEAALLTMEGGSNNRDGMALRILAERLAAAPQKTKLLISISDGQPKAAPDYTGERAIQDLKQVIWEYSRKEIVFLAAAIGQDRETICEIYGQEHFLDITDLQQLPVRLVQVIARYL